MSRNIGDLERNKFFDTNGNTPGVRVGFADGPSVDAFSRLRVSNPNVILDGTADIICVTAQALTGTDTAYAALGYEELY